MNPSNDDAALVRMSAYEGSAAATGLAALCAILAKKDILSSEEIATIIKSMEFTLQNHNANAELSQACVNVRQKFLWF